MLLEISTDEAARLLTSLDFELMCRINPLEYLDYVFKAKGAATVNLNAFNSRFNQVRTWEPRAARAGCFPPDADEVLPPSRICTHGWSGGSSTFGSSPRLCTLATSPSACRRSKS